MTTQGSLTGWAHLSARDGRIRQVLKTDKCSDGRLGRIGREEMGREFAKKIREESGPKPFLGLKSNRVKENQF
jgi:hypothetical protein